MPPGNLPATITVEFGFGSAPDATSLTWTNVTAYVRLADGIEITPGRTAERNSIAPRSCSFTLDNRDDRFNPRNTGGPYYGDLVPRVPVRVRAMYGTTTYTLFRGFVDGGWPQDFLQLARTVPITAVDAVGWAATAPPPRSAYEGEIAALQDVDGATLLGHLRPQSDGWRDHVSGHTFPHSAKFEKLDPLVDGDEESGWSDVEGVGSAVDFSDKIAAPVFTPTSPGLLVYWLRSGWLGYDEPGVQAFGVWSGESTLVAEHNMPGGVGFFAARFDVGISGGGYGVFVGENGSFDDPTQAYLLDGSSHMVAMWSDNAGGAGVWFDGDEVIAEVSSTPTPASAQWTAVGRCLYTPAKGNWDGGAHVIGAVDHITWWTDTNAWTCTVDEAVARLFEAGRLARVGDRMDARMAWILDAAGWDLVGTVQPLVEASQTPVVATTVPTPAVSTATASNTATPSVTLDVSQIVTQQGYRRRNTVLELLQTIEDSEQGRIWVDREGRFRFSARSWPTADTVSNTVQATFGDTGTDLPYSAALSRIVDDDRAVVNVAEVNREYGTMQRSENASSIAAYGRRSPLGISNLLYANDRQSRAVADWMVSAHGEPQARVEVLTFQPVNEAATLVPLACQIEPGWLVRVKRDGYQFDAHVVDVGMRIGMATWDVSLNLDATRAADFTGFTWDDGSGTVGTPWDDGTGTTSGAKGWVF